MTVHSDDGATPSQPTPVMAHEKPLQVLLLDDGLGYGHVQREVLALATPLRAADFVVHVLCPENSSLLHKAKEQEFVTVPLSTKRQGRLRRFMAAFSLLWKYDKKSPLCVHTFSAKTLPLVNSFVSRRMPGTTIAFYSCFAEHLLTTSPANTKDKNITKTHELNKLPRIPSMPSIPDHVNAQAKTAKEDGTEKSIADNSPINNAHIEQANIAEKIILPSKLLQHTWAQARVDVSRLKVVYTACEKNDFVSSAQQEERCVFVVTDELFGAPELDSIDSVLKALVILQKMENVPTFEVRVVSPRLDVQAYVQKASALGVDKYLSILTHLDSDFPIQEVLPHAHVLILPQTAPEGNVHAFMAAWCLGLPIITTQIPGHMELIELADKVRFAGKNLAKDDQAQLIEPDSAESLAKAMYEVMHNSTRLEALTKASLAMSEYAQMPRLQKNYLDIYKDAIASKGWVLPKKS